VGAAVEQVGWRSAWAGVGYALLFGLAPLSLLFAVSTPESCGLRIDLENDEEAKNDRADLTLKNALTSSEFWVFSSASCLFGFMWSAITLFHESILASRGFDQHDFVTVMGIVTAVGLFANLLGAWLATRCPLGRVLGVGMLLLTAALVLFPFVTLHTLLFTYAIFFGISSGLVTVVHFAFHPQAFGRTHLGQIQGVFQVLSVFTSALGPLILAWCKDRFGTYEVLFFVVTPLSLILAAVAIFVPLPVRPLLNSTEGSSS
jgi:MFS family permease